MNKNTEQLLYIGMHLEDDPALADAIQQSSGDRVTYDVVVNGVRVPTITVQNQEIADHITLLIGLVTGQLDPQSIPLSYPPEIAHSRAA